MTFFEDKKTTVCVNKQSASKKKHYFSQPYVNIPKVLTKFKDFEQEKAKNEIVSYEYFLYYLDPRN